MVSLGALAGLLTLAVGLYWKGRHDGVARERPRTEAAQAQAALSGLETRGARDAAKRTDAAVNRREAAAAVVSRLTPLILTSETALAPLDPDRARRLRAADGELCRTAPELTGCAPDRDAG